MKNLLLLHGALGTKDQFDELEKKLNGLCNIYSINFSGHGGEHIPDEPFSMENLSADILNWMNISGIDNVYIFGHSMGGYVGMYLAEKYPTRIDKVFTIATKFDWTKEFALGEVRMLDSGKIKEKVPKFADQLIKRHGKEHWELLLYKVSEMMINLSRDMKLSSQNFMQIEQEVWLGIGDMDKMVSKEETEEVCSLLRNGRIIILPDTPHQFEQMNMNLLKEEIEKFMKE